jgi:peptidyl-prolyl cis-trans isomerase A (cyclophilin A)
MANVQFATRQLALSSYKTLHKSFWSGISSTVGASAAFLGAVAIAFASPAHAGGNSNVKEANVKPTKEASKKMEAKNPVVVMETSLGTIEIELFADKAPISTENFLKYTDKGFYNGTIFHRVISNFMIQGGGFTPDMSQKETMAPIKNEATNGLKNDRGTIAMARTMIVDSATAQFFINVKDNDFLNNRGTDMQSYGYAVFGKVTSGMDVVDKIKAVPTGIKAGMQDVPETAVVIKSVKRK